MENAARLIFKDDQGRSARLETIIAVLFHDPDWDISPILADHLPGLASTSDPRKVMQAFREATQTIRGDIEDALEEDPDVERRMQAIDGVAPVISDELNRGEKAWEKIERNLDRWVIRPVADAIRATVGKLSELLSRERRAQQGERARPDVVTDDDGKKPSSAVEPPSPPKRGFNPQ